MAPNCRFQTLKKKASELATLCGVPVCFVCFTADGGVLTWPEKEPEVRAIISRYRQEQSKKRPLCYDATAPSASKKRKVTRSLSPVPRNAESDDDLLSAKLAILNEKIQELERKNQVRVCDGEIWRELEGVELGSVGEEGECYLTQEEIESWVSTLAEGEMATQSSDLLTLNHQSADFEEKNDNPLSCEQWMNSDVELGMELGELGSVGEEGECSLSQEEIESWVSALAEGEMATQSDLLTLNEQSGDFESPLCEHALIFNDKQKTDSESFSCQQWLESDSELGMELGEFWFGEAETHMDMNMDMDMDMYKRRLSWDWNLLPIPIPIPIELFLY